jgi:hypothetical protein
MNDIQGNAGAFEAHTDAWNRITEAEAAGFFLEAISLEDSIMSSRLLSYVWSDNRTLSPKNATLGAAVREALKVSRRRKELQFVELLHRVRAWAFSRNSLLHGWVMAEPGTSPKPPALRLQQAKDACREGAELAREVLDMHRRLKRDATHPKAA